MEARSTIERPQYLSDPAPAPAPGFEHVARAADRAMFSVMNSDYLRREFADHEAQR